ncbi:MAG: SLC13 family permease [Gemmatimonadota bacterium]|jgi:sodium-dependent dicarboxylate transporter 2/3/5
MVSTAEGRVQTASEEQRPEQDRRGGVHQRIGLIAGPIAFAVVLALPFPASVSAAAHRTAAVALLMAIWWMSEALPLAATALLPLALLPALGVLTPAASAAPYANSVIFLFLGGFVLALGMERWGLHRRIALAVVALVGTSPRRLIGGFMVATAFLSMWISNTATTAMMLPIGLALAAVMRQAPGTGAARGSAVEAGPDRRSGGGDGGVADLPDDDAPHAAFPFGTALMLGIAYAATIGGVATLIGTPPNAVFAASAQEILGRTIGFAEWMMVGLPVTFVLLPIAWVLLVFVLHPPGKLPPGADALLRDERRSLGPMSRGEKMVLVIFCLTALGWIMRSPKQIGALHVPGLTAVLPGIDDSTIAIIAALLLFILPVDWRRGVFVMNWRTARGLPWGVLLLFGGGLSLAHAFEASGLTLSIAHMVSGLAGMPGWVLLLVVVTTFVLLSELASNTAIAALAMPVLAAAAAGTGQNPLLFMAAGALAASAAYMMPVATPPNAIVFGSGYIRMGQMIRAGIWLNIVSIILLLLVGRLIIMHVLL